MGHTAIDEERRRLEGGLLRRVHEQSRLGAERAPFWREGAWRCEFHRRPGDERLKLFQGSRCILEEPVPDRQVADERARELRQAVRSGLPVAAAPNRA